MEANLQLRILLIIKDLFVELINYSYAVKLGSFCKNVRSQNEITAKMLKGKVIINELLGILFHWKSQGKIELVIIFLQMYICCYITIQVKKLQNQNFKLFSNSNTFRI